MKIKELTNAPQWLLDAVVRDENVEIDQNGRVIWHSGQWDRGNFRSGDFLGGNFWGGNFWGGNFLGGDFRGGNFRGGNFWGGNFWGGNFLGGDFWGGDFRGGDFLGGDFWGEKIKLKPILIYGLRWPVVITDSRMMIGCQLHKLQEWEEFNDEAICAMDGKDALRFWGGNKIALLSIARANGRNFSKE